MPVIFAFDQPSPAALNDWKFQTALHNYNHAPSSEKHLYRDYYINWMGAVPLTLPFLPLQADLLRLHLNPTSAPVAGPLSSFRLPQCLLHPGTPCAGHVWPAAPAKPPVSMMSLDSMSTHWRGPLLRPLPRAVAAALIPIPVDVTTADIDAVAAVIATDLNVATAAEVAVPDLVNSDRIDSSASLTLITPSQSTDNVPIHGSPTVSVVKPTVMVTLSGTVIPPPPGPSTVFGHWHTIRMPPVSSTDLTRGQYLPEPDIEYVIDSDSETDGEDTQIWSVKKDAEQKAKGKPKISAARLRVQKDLTEWSESPNIQLHFPDPDDNLNFNLVIEPDEGFYKGGVFPFSVAINQNYPHEPPKVLCTQKIYHPNLDLEGNVCLNILREDWKPVLNLTAVFVGLMFLFHAPNPDDPLNKDAANDLVKDQKGFIANVNASMAGGSVRGVRFNNVLKPRTKA